MHITMIKKRLADGNPCRKCAQAEEMIRQRGLWEKIDEVVWAVENEPESPGLKLGAKYGIELAPFFIVADSDGNETTYTSVLRFLREQFPDSRKPPAAGDSPLPDLAELAAQYQERSPQAILSWGLNQFGTDLAIAFSGAEDVALIDMAAKSGLSYSVFCLDTGRLHPETLAYVERVRKHYGIEIRLMSPDAAALEALVRDKGLFSFYEDGHHECCGIRKVEPLRRALGQYLAWATGQRQDQSPATRSDLAVIEADASFEGRNGAKLVKLNPLSAWTSEQVWAYIREEQVPYNELHDLGYVSIGCAPCTRPRRPGEHERAARWWWEDATKRECGLHLKS